MAATIQDDNPPFKLFLSQEMTDDDQEALQLFQEIRLQARQTNVSHPNNQTVFTVIWLSETEPPLVSEFPTLHAYVAWTGLSEIKSLANTLIKPV